MSRLKTFICSISAIQMTPGVKVCPDQKVIVCELERSSNPDGKFVTAVAQLPLLLVQHESSEAKDCALERARELFPESDGWCAHSAVLIEVPRLTLAQMQLFITLREVLYRALVAAGFRQTN